VTTRRTDYDRVARAIVDIARRAPSVDNTQPWTWCPDRADLGLRADLARALPASDPDGRLLTISCGAALHYARTAAEAMGWDTRVDLLPCPGDPGLLARLRLAPGHVPPEAPAVLDSLRRRHTERRRFTDRPLPDDLLRRLAETVRVPGVVVSAVTDRVLRGRVEGLIEDARLARGGDQAPAAPPAPTTGGLLVIGSTTDDRSAWLRAGIALTGLWLRATSDGLGVVPLSQVLEAEARRDALGREVFGGQCRPQVAIRIGWPETRGRSLRPTPRRSVSDVLRRPRPRTPVPSAQVTPDQGRAPSSSGRATTTTGHGARRRQASSIGACR
jgi:nitroreductase